MAVYTHLTARELAQLIACYDVGALVSAKGIAEGVSNSNWLVETEGGAATEGAPARFILTMYERRIEERDLPFFLGLLDHLAAAGCPVPRTIADRDGAAWRRVRGKPVALIEFLPGISVEHPSPAQARNVGRALAELHRLHLCRELLHKAGQRDWGPTAWPSLLEGCGDALGAIDPALAAIVGEAMPRLLAEWPDDLPRAIVHADLFPDNVLLRGDTVGGLIDFYFACEDFARLRSGGDARRLVLSRRRLRRGDRRGARRGLRGGTPAIRSRARRAAVAGPGRVDALRRHPRGRLDRHAGRSAGPAQGSDGVRPAARLLRRARGRGVRVKHVAIFTDGACKGNPGPGGWGAVLRYAGAERELSGREAETTNNRMELTAAIRALEALTRPCAVTLTTDSRYVVDGITKWIDGWTKRGWMNAAKKPVANADLWRDAGGGGGAARRRVALGERPCGPSGERARRPPCERSCAGGHRLTNMAKCFT